MVSVYGEFVWYLCVVSLCGDCVVRVSAVSVRGEFVLWVCFVSLCGKYVW